MWDIYVSSSKASIFPPNSSQHQSRFICFHLSLLSNTNTAFKRYLSLSNPFSLSLSGFIIQVFKFRFLCGGSHKFDVFSITQILKIEGDVEFLILSHLGLLALITCVGFCSVFLHFVGDIACGSCDFCLVVLMHSLPISIKISCLPVEFCSVSPLIACQRIAQSYPYLLYSCIPREIFGFILMCNVSQLNFRDVAVAVCSVFLQLSGY